jgi:hypothetical protein
MEELFHAGQVSVAQVEEFWTDGEDAVFYAKPSIQYSDHSAQLNIAPCCGGVDLPGFGWAHEHNCPRKNEVYPQANSNQSGSDNMHAASLRRLLRDELMSELIDAARALALLAMPRRVLGLHIANYCRDCGQIGQQAEQIKHLPYCNVGRIFTIIDELKQIPEPNPTTKEAAPGTTEQSRAGEGIRSRVDFGEPWKRSDRLTGIERKDGTVIALMQLEGNSHAAVANADALASRIVDCVNSMAVIEATEGAFLEGGMQ